LPPEYRQAGLGEAVLRGQLAEFARRGCTLAVSETDPRLPLSPRRTTTCRLHPGRIGRWQCLPDLLIRRSPPYAEVAARFGTPAYVYDLRELRVTGGPPYVRHCPPMSTSSIRSKPTRRWAWCEVLAECGVGCGGVLHRRTAAGRASPASPTTSLVSGPHKSAQLVERLHGRPDVLVSVDSVRRTLDADRRTLPGPDWCCDLRPDFTPFGEDDHGRPDSASPSTNCPTCVLASAPR